MGANNTGAATAATAIVLFTDVVGSSRLRQQLGEEAADQLQLRHDTLLGAAVSDSGGRLVKGLGDGMMAVFSSAAEAVGAAVEAQRAVARHARSAPAEAFDIRVGISAGDVGVLGDDIHGAAVIEAARLCDAAQGGQILVADLVRVLSRGRGGYTFESVGLLQLDGLAEPVAACSVGWEPVVDPRDTVIEFPGRLAPSTGVPYVGRPGLLETLHSAWRAVSGGDGSRALLLSGEPGVGKTRTAAEAARQAYDEGGLVLYGACDEFLSTPYQPFVEALDFQSSRAAALPLGRRPGELKRLVPELGRRRTGLPEPVSSDPSIEEHRLFDAVGSWLIDLSTEQPVIFVLDDLHWAGEPTLQLLGHALRGLTAEPAARVLVVGTYRDTELDRAHPLSTALGDLRRIARVGRIAVDNLTVDEVVALAEAAAGHELDVGTRRLAERAYAETEGNPFFVGEVLRHLIESGAIRFHDGRWHLANDGPVDVPEGVKDVVGRRLSRLSDPANDVLRAAAVLGRDADLDVLAELVDGGTSVVLDAVDEALRARLVEESGPDHIRFAHAIVRTTLYEELSESRRRRAHRRVAEVLERVHPDDVEALAVHAIAAGPVHGSLSKAVGYAVAAGERASDTRAHADARRWFERALELSEEDDEVPTQLRLAAACGRAAALRDLGDPTYREALLAVTQEALARDELDIAVRGAVSNTRLVPSIVGDSDTEKVNVLEPLLFRLPEHRTAERARVLALLSSELTHHADAAQRSRRRELAREAQAIAASSGDAELRAWVLVTTSMAVTDPDTLAPLISGHPEIVRLADEVGDPGLRTMARFRATGFALAGGTIERAKSVAEEAHSIAVDDASPLVRWMTSALNVQFRAYAGDLGGARAANASALELGQEIDEPDAALWWGSIEGGIAWLAGELVSFVDTLAQFAEENPGNVSWRTGEVMARTLEGDHEQARSILERHGLERPETYPQDWLTLTAYAHLALGAFVASWSDIGASLARLLEPHRGMWAEYSLFCLHPVEFLFGVSAVTAGRLDEGIDAMERGRSELQLQGLVAHRPMACLFMAEALSRRGRPADIERACALVREGIDAARRIGAPSLVRRLEALQLQLA